MLQKLNKILQSTKKYSVSNNIKGYVKRSHPINGWLKNVSNYN